MMKLDEIIKHVEQVAYNNNDEALVCMGIKEYCEIAELLRELQEHRKAPEIIHCGECKHRDPEDKKCDCGHAIIWQLPRDDNWYCADAERRIDG